MLKQVKGFFSFWYLRYLLATELYILEPWERNVIHIVIGVLFFAFWFINYKWVVSEVPYPKYPRFESIEQSFINNVDS